MSSAATRRGILAMLAAMTLFIGNDALLKLATVHHPPGEIMAVRGLFATVIAVALIALAPGPLQLGGLVSPLVLLRATLEASVAFLFITSLAVMPLANITAILQSTPILMTLMCVALGIERVGWRRWSAIAVAFIGVLLIVRPSPGGFDVSAVIAFATASLVAVRDLVTRGIGPEVPAMVITLAATIAVALVGVLVGAGEDWRPLGAYEIGLLLSAAILVTLGNVAIITALRQAEVSVVSQFRYGNVPIAILLGLVIFGELPNLVSLAGIALIVGSGVYTIHRERALSHVREAGSPDRDGRPA